MMRTFAVIFAILVLLCAPAKAQISPQTMDTLASGAPLGATDIFAVCKNGSSCTALERGSLADLAAFLQSAAVVSCANDASADPTALAAAVATGKNVFIQAGTCNFTTATIGIIGTTKGQRIRGAGYNTLINVGTNTSIATGLFQCTTGSAATPNSAAYNNVGTVWSDMRIVFTQVDTASRPSLRNFSPAFYTQGCYKPTFERLRIEECMVCFDLRGSNSGDAVFRDIEMSPISAGIWIDNGQAPITMDRIYVEPYGAELYGSGHCQIQTTPPSGLCGLFFTINASSPETTTGTDGPIAIYVQYMQDCTISNSLFFIGQGAIFTSGSGGSAECQFVNVGWDSGSGIIVKNGATIRGSNSYFGAQGLVTNAQAVVIPASTTGSFTCSNCKAYGGASPTTVAASSGTLSWIGGVFDGIAGANPMFQCEVAAVCNATGNVVVNTGGNPSWGILMINFGTSSASGIIANNVINAPLGSNSAIWIGFDSKVNVINNIIANTGTNHCPGTQTTMKSAYNGSGSNSTCN